MAKFITIKIPGRDEIRLWWKRTLFKLNGGFRCEDCDSRMFFDSVQINIPEPNKFLFEATNKLQCISCVTDEIFHEQAHIFTEDTECDWCRELCPTVSYFNYHRHEHITVNFIFGKQWWNGHNICCNCLTNHLHLGYNRQTSSILKLGPGSRLYPQNSLGMIQKDKYGLK